MTAFLDILRWAMLVVSGTALAYWSVALFKVMRNLRAVPSLADGLKTAPGVGVPPKLCVIVPAHNEARVIGALARSLASQTYPAFHAVLALDRCTDGTAEIARAAVGPDPRFTILEITESREGWAGKCSAIWSAVVSVPSARDAEYLLFADADTVWHPECARAAVALIGARGSDLLSVMSRLVGGRWDELVVQPAAGLELMRQYPLERANRDRGRRAFANGQFMLFKAETYRSMGGHAAVSADLLEDIALARLVERCGHRATVALSGDLLSCRMYPDWASLRRGWTRIFIEGANRKSSRLARASAVIRWFGAVAPVTAAALAAWAAVDPSADPSLRRWSLGVAAAAVGSYFLSLLFVYRASRAPLWAIPGYPVGAWITGSILRGAASQLRSGVPISWGGRSYVLQDRSAPGQPSEPTPQVVPGTASRGS